MIIIIVYVTGYGVGVGELVYTNYEKQYARHGFVVITRVITLLHIFHYS